MASIFINLLPRRVADKYYNIKKLMKQLHKTASTFRIIKKSLHNNVKYLIENFIFYALRLNQDGCENIQTKEHTVSRTYNYY